MDFQKLHMQVHECMEVRQQPVGPDSPPTCGSQVPRSGSHLTHSALFVASSQQEEPDTDPQKAAVRR